MLSFSGIIKIALGEDLKEKRKDSINKNGLLLLNTVSWFLVGVSLLFLIVFMLGESYALTWFFFCELVAFALIPLLARKGYESTAKFLLIAYMDVGVIILSSAFGEDMLIQLFLVPVCGLAILLYDQGQMYWRNASIIMSVL
ncbi:MAG: hybrid sensor histidine kinase/response regulator, partial [Balneolaceae bacterium]|nr:hybrid sensor histidine kinase/response regulator [Balneolaceae bacterium]